MKIKELVYMAAIVLGVSACSTQPAATDKAPITKPEIRLDGDRFTAEALWAMGRINEAQADVETGLIAYSVSYYSVAENRSTTWIRVLDIDGKVVDEFVGNSPAWFGNGGVLAYLNQGKLFFRMYDKTSIEVTMDDACAQAMAEGVEGFLLSPMRDKVILITQVKTVESTVDKYPDLPLATGRVVDDMMYKHWDEWTESAPQPFVCQLHITYRGEGEAIVKAHVSNPVNILEGTKYESPMKPWGGVEQLAWAPDNKTVAYTCRKKTGLAYAISTNSDIYLYDTETGEERNITEDNKGYDTNPSFSPDGKRIAWLSMEHDGYESDENRLMVLDLTNGEKTFVSKNLNTNVDSYYWYDNERIHFSACWHACVGLYEIDLEGAFRQIAGGQYDYIPVLGGVDEQIYYLRHSMCEANELYRQHLLTNKVTQLTYENKNIYDQVTMGHVEPRWQKTSDGKEMLTWIIYPPHFAPNKKYPTLLYCEGGPQSPVSQFWSYRWNFMMMAANDYIVVAPNRRGLPGFGKTWNEQISGDYGGQCMRDYLSAIDEAARNLPYVDRDHLGAVGASFGGFSVYWLAGHHNKRFKAFIAHDGMFNFDMQYLETEEIWFTNWDLGGPNDGTRADWGAYWNKSNKIAQKTYANSPHLFVDKWDTPILCIHGEKDYRILANQAMAAYDAAKLRGVDAELLIFPDENHWVLKPQNGILWQRTFYAWLDKYLK